MFQSGKPCANVVLPHDKLITWLSALKGIIAAFCGANLVCDKNNSTFSSVILPTNERFISYRFLLIRDQIQMK